MSAAEPSAVVMGGFFFLPATFSPSSGNAMDPRTRKRFMRRAMLERLLALDPVHRAEQDHWLASRFSTLPGLQRAERVLVFVSAFSEEISTRPLLRAAVELGKTLVCPRVDRRAHRLALFRVEDLDADLIPGAMGIPEPAAWCRPIEPGAVDWVLVPGLAFDDRCFRLGRGGGYYDRLLPTLRRDVPRWALIYDEQWVDDLPVEGHDVPLDGVVSPSRTAVRPHGAHSGRTSTEGGSA